jgi:hypothetical protein
MPKIPLVFGSGLDRETGVMAMQPGGMEDLRNVHLLQGKYQVRRGFERVLEFVDDGGNAQTDVLAGIAIRGRRASLFVTYDSVNYKVNVFIGDSTASWYQWLGEWPFLKPGGGNILGDTNPDPPIVLLAEINGIVFMAHSVNVVGWRAQTYWATYSEADQEYQLNPLFVNWERTGGTVEDQEVRFRGVTKWLDYLVGWGWGDVDFDKPEIVRISQPQVPIADLEARTAFDFLHYLNPGDEGDPVIGCYPAGETLIAFKETETWELYGDSYLDFGQRPLDGLFGMEQPRLACSVEGAVFAWTTEGPRVFAGNGTSEGLEMPLELYLPEPYDLPVKLDDKYAFATYMPVYRSIWFCFGKRVYSLYIRISGDWKWGYQELPFEPLSGFRLPQSGWGLAEPPTGYPSAPTMNDIGDQQADVVVTNNGQDGDETLEIWLRPAGGAWALKRSVPVSLAATQEHTLEGLSPGWDYDIAVRYKRGPYYTFGYEASDPGAWPATARGSFTTTLAALPVINSGIWSRTSASTEQILLSITPPYSGASYSVEIRRGGVLVKTETGVTGAFQWADTGITGEAANSYDCRFVSPYVNGAYTSSTVVWGGPLAPTLDVAESNTPLTYTLEWSNAISAYTEVYDSLPSELEADAMDNLRYTENPDQWEHISGEFPASSGSKPWCAVRHKVTTYGITDYSNHSAKRLTNAM